MRVLNFGSLNIDLVYRVSHIVRPGETISSVSHQRFAGGKGANQSAALAHAGATISHAGQIGKEGRWLVEKLRNLGVNMQFTRVTDAHTGHAIIQVEKSGQNSIVLYPGANTTQTREHIDATLNAFTKGDILLLQNEINELTYLMEQAAQLGMRISFNPAPFDSKVPTLPLDLVEFLIVNETEAAGLVKPGSGADMLQALSALLPQAHIVLTLGENGALYRSNDAEFHIPAVEVEAVDTTAAGDTFTGYFIAGLAAHMSSHDALSRAAYAAALCVTHLGAMDSIPTSHEVDNLLNEKDLINGT